MSGSSTGVGENLPLLVLTSQRDSHPFRERTIVLKEVVIVGRSVARFRPSDTNAIFDCKVLSRSHALIWFKDGRFWLRDTKSSNGTFVNNTRVVKKASDDYADREIFSGDIIRFGVDVVEHDTTHGCIIARATLFYPTGNEAKPNLEPIGSTNGAVGIETLHAEQVFRLAHFVTEALFREQVLENKLSSMSQLLQETREISEASWQAMLNEERLLHTLDLYECQLSMLKQHLQPDSLQSQLCQALEEKMNLEKASKMMLNRLVKENAEVLSKVTTLECCLSDSERECARLRQKCETTSEAYQSITRDFDAKFMELKELEKELKEVQCERDVLKTQLHERVNEVEMLQKNVDLASVRMNSHKIPYAGSTDVLIEASECNASINGLDKALMTNPEHIGGALESALNKRDVLREDIFAADLIEPNRLCDIRDRLADSEANVQIIDSTTDDLSKHLADIVRHFHQSMQLIRSLHDELATLSQHKSTLGSDLKTTSSFIANASDTPFNDLDYSNPSEHAPPVSTMDSLELNEHTFLAALLRAKSITARAAAYHARTEASLSSYCALQKHLNIPSVCNTSGDVCAPAQSNQPNSHSDKVDERPTLTHLPFSPPLITGTDITEPKHLSDSEVRHFMDTEVQSIEGPEVDRLKEELRMSQNLVESCRQLAEAYREQDAAKAELLLSVREECDTLRKRIAHIETDVATSREDHQRLVAEARRTRSEAEELRQERDTLNAQVLTCTRRIEQLQTALAGTTNYRLSLGDDHKEGFHSNQPNLTEASPVCSHNPVSFSSGSFPFLSRPPVGTLSLFVVVPIMMLVLALITYVYSKFTR